MIEYEISAEMIAAALQKMLEQNVRDEKNDDRMAKYYTITFKRLPDGVAIPLSNVTEIDVSFDGSDWKWVIKGHSIDQRWGLLDHYPLTISSLGMPTHTLVNYTYHESIRLDDGVQYMIVGKSDVVTVEQDSRQAMALQLIGHMEPISTMAGIEVSE